MTKQNKENREMKKYTVYNYLYGEMDTPSHKMFLLMDDGVKFDVDL